MKEAGNHKEAWYNRMKDKGLRVKLALNDNGQVGGMIQYLPIEPFAAGNGLYFVNRMNLQLRHYEKAPMVPFAVTAPAG